MSGPFSEPMTVTTVEGEVVVLGPDAIGVSLTPASAEESAHRLLRCAEEARRTATGPRDELA